MPLPRTTRTAFASLHRINSQLPFNKGGQGGFLAGPKGKEESWMLGAAPLIWEQLLKSVPSRTFGTTLIFWSAPARRRFFEACGSFPIWPGATCRASGKRRRVAALQKVLSPPSAWKTLKEIADCPPIHYTTHRISNSFQGLSFWQGGVSCTEARSHGFRRQACR